MGAAWLPQVLAQQLSRVRMKQPNVPLIPLHLDSPSDPARRSAVVSSLDFHAAIHMNCTFAVLVVAEWLRPRAKMHGADPGRLQISGGGFAADAGFSFDAPQRPSQPPQRDDLVLLFFNQDVAHIDGAYPPSVNVLVSFSLAGFQVIPYGRFWVIPEGLRNHFRSSASIFSADKPSQSACTRWGSSRDRIPLSRAS
jgi:hypothetical protein